MAYRELTLHALFDTATTSQIGIKKMRTRIFDFSNPVLAHRNIQLSQLPTFAPVFPDPPAPSSRNFRRSPPSSRTLPPPPPKHFRPVLPRPSAASPRSHDPPVPCFGEARHGNSLACCKKASSTLRDSRAVPHPSTNRALRRLTAEFGRDPVLSTRYGRWRHTPSRRQLSSAVLRTQRGVTKNRVAPTALRLD